MKQLIEQYIKSIYISEDSQTIAIAIGIGFLIYRTESYCGSESWFDYIHDPINVLGESNDYMSPQIIGYEINETITVEKDDPLYKSKRRNSSKVIKIYRYTFKTKKGYTYIEYRSDCYCGEHARVINIEDAKVDIKDKELFIDGQVMEIYKEICV